ncbi:MAG: PKD domain-containing protein, partial [archaeon]|nr:PKD domain-containing protein [archaeon]
GDIDFNSQILSYIDSRYQGDCSSGCYIPVKLTSNVDNQLITINEMSIKYDNLLKSNNSFYVLDSSSAKISLSELTAIELSGAGLKVPTTAGQQTLVLSIAGEQILTKKIDILNLPFVTDLYPNEVPAGAEIIFYATTLSKNISSYKWDFGDGTPVVESTKNSVSHKYSSAELKSYKLSITVKNNLGETNSSFMVKTISPKEYLGSLITNYKGRLATVKKQVTALSANVKTSIESALDLSNIELKLNNAIKEYNSLTNQTTENYVSILSSLYGLNMPKSVLITQKISGMFFVDPTKITSADLSSATGEPVSVDEASLQGGVSDWNLNNINANVNIETYSSVTDEGVIPIASFVKITANFLDGTDDGTIYAVIAVSKDKITELSISTPTYSTNSVSFPIDIQGGEKSFSFVVLGDVDLMQLPIYFTPVASKLSFSRVLGSCNHNGICEADENKSNCGDDCKPIGLAIFWFILLIIVVLVAYIGLQEWYKRRYEEWLFKDKNDLFNLASFIENAEKQGLSREEIFAKLKEKNWPSEQVVFAYKKYKGMRTGMFEIPIFTLLEKTKLLKTLNLKKKIGTEQKIAPEPRRPFTMNMPGKPSIIPFMNKENRPDGNGGQKTI